MSHTIREIRWRRLLWLCIAASLCVPAAGRAQDSRYWTNQYGTQAQLLGSAVVGRAVDLSTTFYNPAAIVFVSEGSGVVLTGSSHSSRARADQKFQLWGIGVDFLLGRGFTSDGALSAATGALFLVMSLSSSEKLHKAATAIAWVMVVASLVLQSVNAGG